MIDVRSDGAIFVRSRLSGRLITSSGAVWYNLHLGVMKQRLVVTPDGKCSTRTLTKVSHILKASIKGATLVQTLVRYRRCGFARFNTIITSLKALDEGFSSKNYVRKFLRALHPKWRAKVTKGKLVTQPIEEKKSFRQRDKKKGKSDQKCFRCVDPTHLIGDCLKPPRNKDQKAFIGVSLPISQSVIGTKWVFRNNLDENGIVSRNKATLVAQGYNQQEGIDYDENYAPIARLDSIRILLAIACANDFKLYQMDVKSAFLNGFINEEVYVAQPLGFIDFAKPNYVYKLEKALYGLKQAPKAWLRKTQEKDKIGSKPDKNGKRGEAEKSQKQLQ
uniref:Copia protein n=1 Tax=Tanacetum cinerariifolium TaxID=118510 RepID=A0A6L2N1J2_TANCI|nr:copia protein [Tanacetum cinerariifolium]